MTENKQFTIADGFKIVAIRNNGKIMNSIQVCDKLNELAEENTRLKEERKGFEGCSHNWGILYDEAKNKVEELSKENRELKKELLELIDASTDNRPNKKEFMGNGRFA